jgi:hypothetical protein
VLHFCTECPQADLRGFGGLGVVPGKLSYCVLRSHGCPAQAPRRKRAKKHRIHPMNAVCVYVDTSKQVGNPDHLKVFASEDAAETWLQENDPEGVAFEYEVLE